MVQDSTTFFAYSNSIAFQKQLAFHRLIETIEQKKLEMAIAHTFQNTFIVGDLVREFLMMMSRKTKSSIARKSSSIPSTPPIYPGFRPRLQDLK